MSELSKSINYQDRKIAAKKGQDLELLSKDSDYRVRCEVAKRGYAIGRLSYDRNYCVRLTLAQNGFALEKLKNDSSPIVRTAVAKRGYALAELAKDKDYNVRIAVIENGYQPHIFLKDKELAVRFAALNMIEDFGLFIFDNKVVSGFNRIPEEITKIIEEEYGDSVKIYSILWDWYVKHFHEIPLEEAITKENAISHFGLLDQIFHNSILKDSEKSKIKIVGSKINLSLHNKTSNQIIRTKFIKIKGLEKLYKIE